MSQGRKAAPVSIRRQCGAAPFGYFTGECYLEFHYRTIRVWEVPVESVLSGGIGTLPLAPLAAMAPDELPHVIRRMEQRLTTEIAPADAASLWSATYILNGAALSV